MKPAPFVYHRPRTLDDAVAVLAEVGPRDGRVLAGGQSLVPTMAFRLARPAHLVDINDVAGLDRLMLDGDELSIGAVVRHGAFCRPVIDGPLGRLLAHVVQYIAHVPIRSRGTFCGSLAHADPASEWCLVATALGATMNVRGARGARAIPAHEYFRGLMSTSLEDDEILVEARLPNLSADTHFGFCELSRRAGDYALAMVLVLFRISDGAVVSPRIAVGGVEERPRRLPEAEAALAGRRPSVASFRMIAEAAADLVDPMTDTQADAPYRRDLIRALVPRAFEQACT